ncbi:MAG: T9SS type A sorting domain-containing protein [Candidatus Zixiibacteriota bacterium]|nr:MAG: T9SS type A sorting domain-containing protein [candidate division Zixibacteria bacterium]
MEIGRFINFVRLSFICVFICLTYKYSISDENRWSTNGPAGGSVHSIEIHPQNPQIIFIGTIHNGIYKTTDGGNLWNHIETDDQLRCMREIAIHPYAPDTIYATSTEGIFKSSDNGVNWIKLYPPQGIDNEYSAFVIHPDEPSLLFAGGPFNEWKSTDGGQNWEQLNIPRLVGVEDFAIDPSNTDIIYLVTNTTYYGYGIFKSTDRGHSWLSIQNNIAGEFFCWSIDIDPQNSLIVYLGLHNPNGTDSCLFKSTNGGQSWTEVSPRDLTIGGFFKVSVSPYENNTIFACSINDGIFISTDGGLNWGRSNEGLKVLLLASIEFDIINNIIYLAVYYDGIYKSINNASSWQKISTNINIAICQGLAISPITASNAFVATVSGLQRTVDGGQSWEYVDVGFPPYHGTGDVEFDLFNPTFIYLCTHHRFWVNPILETGFYRSTDNGDTWHFFNNGLPGENSYVDIAISYLGNDNRRIFLSSYRGIYYSDDIGQTWNQCTSGIPQNTYINALAVAPSDQNIVAAGTGWLNNQVFLSSDRGGSWYRLYNYPDTTGWAVMDIKFHPFDALHIYVGTDGAGIFESADGGDSWASILNDLPADPDYPTVGGIAINPYNPSNMFVSSSRYGIYQSHNGGQNWEPFNNGLDTTATAGHIEFAAADTNHLYFASTERSVWTITRTPTGIDDKSIKLPAEISIETYPNPFNSEIIIKYNSNSSERITLNIYDIMGRKVKTLIDETARAGLNTARWNGTNEDNKNCPSGVYFARLEAGVVSKTAKMVLLK